MQPKAVALALSILINVPAILAEEDSNDSGLAGSVATSTLERVSQETARLIGDVRRRVEKRRDKWVVAEWAKDGALLLEFGDGTFGLILKAGIDSALTWPGTSPRPQSDPQPDTTGPHA